MIESILKLREEIKELEAQKRKIQFSLAKKVAKLKSLELLTVNQLDLFGDKK